MEDATIFVLVLTSLLLTVDGYPNGAPNSACMNMMPHHPFPVTQSDAPYELVVNEVLDENNKIVACE